RAIIIENAGADGKIAFLEEASAHLKKTAIIKNPDQNQQLNAAIRHIGLPIPVNFIDVRVDESDVFVPSVIVILPDFLVGVTSVSECFQSGG
ncbi:MAG: hypothetical protein HKO89_01850, partial [Saprospiraceae bacterium]|nr:hypothetical protein [Saprospiraceae bacterium]